MSYEACRDHIACVLLHLLYGIENMNSVLAEHMDDGLRTSFHLGMGGMHTVRHGFGFTSEVWLNWGRTYTLSCLQI